MDRNYYYEKMQKQHEREISNLWAYPLESSHEPLNRKQAIRLIRRIAFAVVVVSLFANYLF